MHSARLKSLHSSRDNHIITFISKQGFGVTSCNARHPVGLVLTCCITVWTTAMVSVDKRKRARKAKAKNILLLPVPMGVSSAKSETTCLVYLRKCPSRPFFFRVPAPNTSFPWKGFVFRRDIKGDRNLTVGSRKPEYLCHAMRNGVLLLCAKYPAWVQKGGEGEDGRLPCDASCPRRVRREMSS